MNLDRVTLRGETGGKVKTLKNYQKGPSFDGKNERMLAKYAEGDVGQDIEMRFTALRESLSYKRKEIEVSRDPESPSGTIRTPDFEYHVSLLLDPEDPDSVLWRRELTHISNAELLKSDRFAAVFGDTFDTLVLPFPEPKDIADLVDTIEDEEVPGVKVDCPSDCSWCEVQLPGLPGRVRVEPSRLELKNSRVAKAGDLIDTFLEFQKFFSDMGE